MDGTENVGGDRKRRRRNAFGPNSAEAKLVTQVAQAYFIAENLEIIHEGVDKIILSVEAEIKNRVESSPNELSRANIDNNRNNGTQTELTVINPGSQFLEIDMNTKLESGIVDDASGCEELGPQLSVPHDDSVTL